MVAGRVLAAVVLVSGVLTACGQGGRESLLDKSTLVVGVRPDLPGLGLRHPDGRFEGFDIDVARYVAAGSARRCASCRCWRRSGSRP
ncbi:hypothetical protein [Actinomadura madurae]|uniref:hypothetical protein n=1 Tax=Actinomadura madurae TaxID=1993 RepID=UPI0020D24835|nr:hypothetical protein [Actinomadura madurae]MCQ0015795.1 hypothetical protein [Actinomadura madurae]